MIVSGATAALYLGTESEVVAFVGVFLWGVDTAFFFVPARTLLQRYAPAAFHGRVLSLNQSLEPAAGHRDDAPGRARARRGERPGPRDRRGRDRDRRRCRALLLVGRHRRRVATPDRDVPRRLALGGAAPARTASSRRRRGAPG